MATHYLMERGPERMNVPDDKHQQYLDAGWTELSRYQVSGSQPKPKPAPEPAPAAKPKSRKK